MTDTSLWLPVIGKGRKQSIRSLPPGGYDTILDCLKRDRSSLVAERLATPWSAEGVPRPAQANRNLRWLPSLKSRMIVPLISDRLSRCKGESGMAPCMVEVFSDACFRAMELITILDRCHHFRGFVYLHARFSADNKSIEVAVRPRQGSSAVCSRCHQTAPGYDQLAERRFELIPLWGFFVFLSYAMRRVDCRRCEAVVVEEVPWGNGKHQLTNAYMRFLARWARRLSWKETAEAFHPSFFERGRKLAKAADRGEPIPSSRVVAFEDVEALLRLGKRGRWLDCPRPSPKRTRAIADHPLQFRDQLVLPFDAHLDLEPVKRQRR